MINIEYPEERLDMEIQAEIKRRLDTDVWIDGYLIDVNVEFGVVTLTGVVENFKAKKAAEQDAQNTRGVIRVKNYLKVRPDNVLSDNEIGSSGFSGGNSAGIRPADQCFSGDHQPASRIHRALRRKKHRGYVTDPFRSPAAFIRHDHPRSG
jgi:hypothetical protein